MNGSPVNANRPLAPRRGLRILALVVAVICVLAVAAGAFVLSYTGARDLALSAGVSTQLARIYPWIFDAVVVVAAFAALSLRGVLRGWAWLAFLVAAGAIAFADAVHAASVTFPKEPTEVTVAAAPWAVLLIGFTLLYALARQTRPGRPAAAGGQVAAAPVQTAPVPLSTLLGERPNTRPERAQAARDAQVLADPAPKRPAAADNAEPAPRAEPDPPPAPPAESQPVPDSAAGTEATVSPGPATAPPAATGAAAAGTEAAGTEAVGPAPVSPATTGSAAASPEPARPAPALTAPLPSRATTGAAEPAAAGDTSEFRSAQPPGGRDEPSDADAEPAEPAVHFNRLRSSPLPPGE